MRVDALAGRRAAGARRRLRRRRLDQRRIVVAVTPDAEQALLQRAVGGEALRLDHAVDAAVDHDGDVLGHRARDADVLLDDQHRHLAVLGELAPASPRPARR